jgi:hypothetical protein
MGSVKGKLRVSVDGCRTIIAEELQFCLYPLGRSTPLNEPVMCARALQEGLLRLLLASVLWL